MIATGYIALYNRMYVAQHCATVTEIIRMLPDSEQHWNFIQEPTAYAENLEHLHRKGI